MQNLGNTLREKHGNIINSELVIFSRILRERHRGAIQNFSVIAVQEKMTEASQFLMKSLLPITLIHNIWIAMVILNQK
ncbi:hypothetical protein A9993_15845 [Rahnella victoriana]|nr:hypothetical protein A9993_15845 [Rahnella victoriana]